MLKKLFLVMAMAIGLMAITADSVSAQVNMMGGNSRLDRRVRSELLSLPYYGVFDVIGYQINGDTVTLTGYVARPTTKDAAEDAVEDN